MDREDVCREDCYRICGYDMECMDACIELCCGGPTVEGDVDPYEEW